MGGSERWNFFTLIINLFMTRHTRHELIFTFPGVTYDDNTCRIVRRTTPRGKSVH